MALWQSGLDRDNRNNQIVSIAAWVQVVSGLAKYIPLEAMQGKRVVLVANLKPANMRGVKSQAMVLAATSPDGTKVCFTLKSEASLTMISTLKSSDNTLEEMHP